MALWAETAERGGGRGERGGEGGEANILGKGLATRARLPVFSPCWRVFVSRWGARHWGARGPAHGEQARPLPRPSWYGGLDRRVAQADARVLDLSTCREQRLGRACVPSNGAGSATASHSLRCGMEANGGFLNLTLTEWQSWPSKLAPFLWFNDNAEEAAEFYLGRLSACAQGEGARARRASGPGR